MVQCLHHAQAKSTKSVSGKLWNRFTSDLVGSVPISNGASEYKKLPCCWSGESASILV